MQRRNKEKRDRADRLEARKMQVDERRKRSKDVAAANKAETERRRSEKKAKKEKEEAERKALRDMKAEELRKMKVRLRDMYIVNKQMKRGPGFGRASWDCRVRMDGWLFPSMGDQIRMLAIRN